MSASLLAIVCGCYCCCVFVAVGAIVVVIVVGCLLVRCCVVAVVVAIVVADCCCLLVVLLIVAIVVADCCRCVQDTLRSQGVSGKSYDLVTAVARYFRVLVAHADEAGVLEAIQAMNTLVDMVQGPCVGNIATVIDAKVVEACKRLLSWSDADRKVRRHDGR